MAVNYIHNITFNKFLTCFQIPSHPNNLLSVPQKEYDEVTPGI